MGPGHHGTHGAQRAHGAHRAHGPGVGLTLCDGPAAQSISIRTNVDVEVFVFAKTADFEVFVLAKAADFEVFFLKNRQYFDEKGPFCPAPGHRGPAQRLGLPTGLDPDQTRALYERFSGVLYKNTVLVPWARAHGLTSGGATLLLHPSVSKFTQAWGAE